MRTLRSAAVCAAVCALVLGGSPSVAVGDSDDRDRQRVYSVPGEMPVGWSVLERDDDEVEASVSAWLAGGHAYTMWWVVFNHPERCSHPCGEDDVFTNGGLNIPSIRNIGVSVLWAAGSVARPSGWVKLRAELGVGEVPGQVLIGMPTSSATGLLDSQHAEVHLVLVDHGVASTDPAVLHQQLTTVGGGCQGRCPDAAFSIHLAAPDHHADDDDEDDD